MKSNELGSIHYSITKYPTPMALLTIKAVRQKEGRVTKDDETADGAYQGSGSRPVSCDGERDDENGVGQEYSSVEIPESGKHS